MLEDYIAWVSVEDKRVEYERSKCSEENKVERLAITDAHYQRIGVAREKYGITEVMLHNMLVKFTTWLAVDNKRVGYEWQKCNEENKAECLAIAEVQYQRVGAAMAKYGITEDLMRKWWGV